MDKDMPGWEKSDGENSGVFNCSWKPSNVIFRDGIMILNLTKNPKDSSYASGEYTTLKTYGFGYYEARMKATKGAGLVAGTFFISAGTWGEDSHNEIDFEFVGPYPTQVQTNYFYAGKGNHEKMIDLGFDASKDFHNYGFKWTSSSIEWYVDGKFVRSVTKNIPQDPCRIIVNFWPGTSGLSEWLGGEYKGNGDQVQYDWIKFKDLQENKNIKAPAKVVDKAPAGNMPGRSIENVARSADAFNGATGGISGSTITLRANSTNDAGLTIRLNSETSGKLSFDYSGTTTGNLRNNRFTLVFIKAGARGDWRNDAQLGEQSFAPDHKAQHADIEIPEGTTKINVMLLGNGSADIRLGNVQIQ